MILVADDQGSIALEVLICSWSLAGVMHLTVRAKMPNFAFLADVTASQTPNHRTKGDIKTHESRLPSKRLS